MSQKTVFVLHKNGAPNHYTALEYYLQKQGKSLKHREFSIIGNFYKAAVRFNGQLFIKQIVNLGFLVSLLLTKNKSVVLGIAPYDKKLVRLLPILKKHNLFYHTSWTCWDGSFQPKPTTNKKVLQAWRTLLEREAQHVFAVSSVAKYQLLSNFNLSDDKVSVVYHTLRAEFLSSPSSERTKDCIYIGRLVPQKGIPELLDYFSNQDEQNLTIIGDGKLAPLVAEKAKEFAHIDYLGAVHDTSRLKTILEKHRYLVLNSIRTEKWEELFGIVIIESMAQGLIPISSNHAGPRSIIDNQIGYLFEEGQLTSQLNAVFSTPYDQKKSDRALRASKFYDVKNISQFWAAIDKMY